MERLDKKYQALADAEREAAKTREYSGKGTDGSGGRGNKKNPTESVPQGLRRAKDADDKIADLAGTNGRYMSDARKVAESDPGLHEKVKSGEIKLPQAVPPE
jgi:hypothetical protein